MAQATFEQYLELGSRIKDGRLTRETVQAIIEGRIKIDADIPPNHYRIRVNRGPLPPMATLEEQFGKGNVSQLFDGNYEWKRHFSQMGANSVTADEVVIYVHDFGRNVSSNEPIAWGFEHGCVPADHKEAYAFSTDPQTRDLQRKHWLVALGAFAMYDDHRYVAVLRGNSDRRIFGSLWFSNGWDARCRFLFVRPA